MGANSKDGILTDKQRQEIDQLMESGKVELAKETIKFYRRQKLLQGLKLGE